MRKIRFFQTDSYVSIDYLERSVECYTRVFKNDQPFIERKQLHVPEGEPLKLEIEAFIESIINGSEPKVTAEDAKEALLVANKMVKKIMERQGEINKIINDHQ
jgi:predicted dehydrogenase